MYHLKYLLLEKVYAADQMQVVPNTEDATIGGLIANGLNYLMFFVGVAAISGIVYGGVLFILSAGNPDKLQVAKRALIWSIAGLLVVIMAFTIIGSLDTIING